MVPSVCSGHMLSGMSGVCVCVRLHVRECNATVCSMVVYGVVWLVGFLE